MKTIRAAALQLAAHDRDEYARTRERLLERIDDAAAGRDLLVVPEGTFPAYVLGWEPVSPAEAARDIDALREIASRRKTVIVAGIALPGERGTTNAAVAVDSDGRVAGRADKVFLWHFDRQWFAAGDAIAAVDTAVGRIGMLVCADGRMPGIARALVDDGAQLLAMPTAWVTSGRNADALENVQADLLARVRAFENGVPFIAANKCGVERGMVAYCGKSQIVDASGNVVAMAGERHEATIDATVSSEPASPRRALDPAAPAAAAARPQPARVALSLDFPSDVREHMRILETDVWLTAERNASGDALHRLGALSIAGDDLLDPLTGVRARRAGYRAIHWRVTQPDAWTVTIARARALELRMYVFVFEGTQRAYAVDPDGVVVAGTYGHLRTASFVFDAARTAATLVAPGTDVDAGIAAVEALVRP